MKVTKPKKITQVEKLKAPLLDPSFKYINSSATDVQVTWRKHGWVPPSEMRNQNEKAQAI